MSASPKPADWSERQRAAQERKVGAALSDANARYVAAVAAMGARR